MSFLQRDDADQFISPLFEDFKKIFFNAWGDWRNGTIAHQMQHKRVRANFVWNQLISHAKRAFDKRTDVRVDVLKKWDGVLVGDKIFIRMKKGTNKLLSRNYPTQTALNFHDQTADLFGGVIRLELLYILNAGETDIERIVLVQRHHKSVAWAIDLLQVRGEQQNVISLLPQQPSPNQGSVADRIIKSKAKRKNDEQLETGNAS